MAFQFLDFEIIFYMNGMKLFIIGTKQSIGDIFKVKKHFFSILFQNFHSLRDQKNSQINLNIILQQ